MRKLKYLFLSLAIISTLGMCLVGCNKTDNSNANDTSQKQQETNSVLTIGETKTIVLNALKVDDNTKTLNANLNISQSEDGNRNIFVKLGTAYLLIEWDYTDETFAGLLQKNSLGDIIGFAFEQGTSREYYDGNDVYNECGTSYSKRTFEDAGFAPVFNGFDCIFLDLLFVDDAWGTIYKTDVNKVINNNGYDLNLDIIMPNYCDFVMAKSTQYGLGAEGLFGDGEVLNKNKTEGSAKLKIKMDRNNNITALIFDVNTLYVSGGVDSEGTRMSNTKLTVSKYNTPLTAPSWFNIDNYQWDY